MDNDQTIIQIHAFLSGHLSAEERTGFQAWLEESAENRTLFTEVKEAWDLAGSYLIPSFDTASSREAMPFMQDAPSVTAEVQDVPVVRSLSIKRWSAAAAILLLVAVGVWMFNNKNHNTLLASGDTSQHIDLEDGSSIYLKSNGVVMYPKHFSNNSRLVELDGEAYFDIARDESRKFIVETDHAMITVLGTEFGVNEREDGVVEVHVAEGKVRIDPNGSDVFLELTQGQSAYFDSNTGELKRIKTSDLNEIAWHTRKLSFKATKIHEIVKCLEEVYNVKIKVAIDDVSNCSLSSNYTDQSLEIILSDLSQIWGCKVIQSNDVTYSLYGGNCN